MIQIAIILLTTILLQARGENDQQLPFCKVCSCTFKDNKPPAEVLCTKNVHSDIINTQSWLNAQNQSYQYSKITINNQNLIELNFTFPKSDLVYLNLADNDIFRIGGSVFKNLQNMETLILSHNDLELLHPEAFKGVYMEGAYTPLKSLKILKLDHNRLHTLDMDIFEHTTDIEVLDLSYNPFRVIDSHVELAIDSLIYLKELYLGHTNIVTLPENMLHTPKYLQVLDLSGNPINKVPTALEASKNLTTLYMNDTAFVNLTKENGFPSLPSLKTLYLCHLTDLERIEKNCMSGLTGLEELHVTDNIKLYQFDSFALAKVQEETGAVIWPAIKKLYLQNNMLSYLNSDIIARWDGLKDLDINHNPWTCEYENQWLVDDLMPVYLRIDEEKAKQVRCAAPIEMEQYTLYELYERKYQMRSLDMYGDRPEQDAAMLVGVLAGILIAIPLVLFILLAYQKKWFGLFSMCDNSAAAYSRRYYRATSKQDDYI